MPIKFYDTLIFYFLNNVNDYSIILNHNPRTSHLGDTFEIYI